MLELAERLRQTQERLDRLLAGGLRMAGAEAPGLLAEAEALEGAGAPELAARLREAAAACDQGSATRWLGAVTLAAAQCRMLRVRLVADPAPPGAWQPLTPAGKPRAKTDRLLPLGRIALEGGEAWACARLRSTMPDSLVLITPPPALPDFTPWLTRPLEGALRWQGRFPLGASGEVQACSLEAHAWDAPPEPDTEDPRRPFLDALKAGKLKPGQNLWRHGGPLEVRQLAPGDIESCVWPDAAAPAAARGALKEPAWALFWAEGPLYAPVCLLQPGGILRRPRLLHLLPGLPGDPLSL